MTDKQKHLCEKLCAEMFPGKSNPDKYRMETVAYKAGFVAGVESERATIESLKGILKQFADDDNWLIENEYADRAIKTIGADWIYIGKWDPRVMASHAINGEYFPNTKPEERKQASEFYRPSYAHKKIQEQLEKELARSEKLVETLKGIRDLIVKPISMTDAEMQLFEVEIRCCKALKEHADGK